jgi:hypothetical protein
LHLLLPKMLLLGEVGACALGLLLVLDAVVRDLLQNLRDLFHDAPR